MTLVVQAGKGRLYGGGLKSVARFGGQCRALWNLFLAETVARYEAEQKFVFYAEMSARLPKLLKEDPRLSGLPHRCAQMTVQKLDRTLRDCFKSKAKRKGFPKFKSRHKRADAFAFVGREVRVEAGRIRLPKIGWLRTRGLALPPGADLKQVAVTQEPNGWYVSVQFEASPKVYAMPTLPAVGIDAGLDALIALGVGLKTAPPKFARKAEKHVRRLNRERDRRRKASVHRRRTVARLARLHRAVADRRKDFAHKATRALVDAYEGFAVEDLSLKGLMKTRLAKSFADASLGELLRMLRYKAEWAARSWAVYPRFKRSTGVCPDCDLVGPKLSLSVRTWTCEGCGVVHDRDTAAGRVILAGATVARAAGVVPVRREPVSARRRKPGAAVRGGVEAHASVSHGGPPRNVAKVPAESSV